jgi:hypothetical protein
MMRHLVFGLTAAAAIAGCGDNARTCGAGTMELQGVCVPASTTACGDGTKLDNGQCVVDPETCQAGTVLIADRCVDPSHGLTIDLEESPEPNALGIAGGVEASASPAGTIKLKPAGQTFVVHGHLTPFRDADADGELDPDFDTYVINVPGPTLLTISVDGVGGAQGAFYTIGDSQGIIPDYERYGLNLTGDTSKRRLFLPAPGLYKLAISDTRSLSIGGNPPRPAGSGGAAGGPDAEYFASITVEPVPAPSQITVTAGSGSHDGLLATDEVEFFTAALGAGSNDIREVMPGAATASVAVVNADTLEGYADENPGGVSRPPTEAKLTISGFKPADTPLIAVDAVYNYGPAPEPFTLTVTVH